MSLNGNELRDIFSSANKKFTLSTCKKCLSKTLVFDNRGNRYYCTKCGVNGVLSDFIRMNNDKTLNLISKKKI